MRLASAQVRARLCHMPALTTHTFYTQVCDAKEKIASPNRLPIFYGRSLRPNLVHSAGVGVQAASPETAQTVHDPGAHDHSQGYSLLALLALIADKMTN